MRFYRNVRYLKTSIFDKVPEDNDFIEDETSKCVKQKLLESSTISVQNNTTKNLGQEIKPKSTSLNFKTTLNLMTPTVDSEAAHENDDDYKRIRVTVGDIG